MRTQRKIKPAKKTKSKKKGSSELAAVFEVTRAFNSARVYAFGHHLNPGAHLYVDHEGPAKAFFELGWPYRPVLLTHKIEPLLICAKKDPYLKKFCLPGYILGSERVTPLELQFLSLEDRLLDFLRSNLTKVQK